MYDTIGWGGVVFLMAVESAAIPFPSELIMPLAGWLLVLEKGGGWGMLAWLGCVAPLATCLGSWIAYWVSLKGGRLLLLKYGKYVLISLDEIERTERWFDRYGEPAVFFGRLLPVIRTFISVPAGLARMNLWKFSIYTFAGVLPLVSGVGLRRVRPGRELGNPPVGHAPLRYSHHHPDSTGGRLVLVSPHPEHPEGNPGTIFGHVPGSNQ